MAVHSTVSMSRDDVVTQWSDRHDDAGAPRGAGFDAPHGAGVDAPPGAVTDVPHGAARNGATDGASTPGSDGYSDGYPLDAGTEAGRLFVRAAENHVAPFRARAAGHDREGRFAFENVRDMRESGVMAAAVPREHGGMGVESLRDLMVGMSRIARGDAATAIAANMHIAGGAVIVRMLCRARATGDDATAGVLLDLLARIGGQGLTLCFPTTEPGTDLASPLCEIVAVEGGYRLNGTKIFATISPAADLFFPSVRLARDGGGYRTGTVMLARGAPGMAIGDDWDALGMRASGSNAIRFTDCFVPADRLFGVRDNYAQIGRGFADFALTANLPLIASFLGVAEAARACAVTAVAAQRKGPSGKLLGDRIPIQMLVAEIEVDIATCRALVDRLGRIADAFLARYRDDDAPVGEANALMKEVQCMKYVVNRKAIDVVDRAMTVCGGSAYMAGHPLSRLYRDVRAGPFMQPFAPYEALEYIGKVALGRDPALDR